MTIESEGETSFLTEDRKGIDLGVSVGPKRIKKKRISRLSRRKEVYEI